MSLRPGGPQCPAQRKARPEGQGWRKIRAEGRWRSGPRGWGGSGRGPGQGPTSLNGLLQLLMLGLQLGKDASPTQVFLQLLGRPKKSPEL